MKPHLIKTLAAATLLALPFISTSVIAREHSDSSKKLYPNATRSEPKLDLTSTKEQKSLNDALDAVNRGDKDKALQLLQSIIDGSKSQYAKALALQGLANVKYQGGDIKEGLQALKQALAIGVLPNDTYFQLEYELAQLYATDSQFQASLDTIAKWRAEGRRETAESYGLEGNDDYQLGKYEEAITAIKKAQSIGDKPQDAWNQILLASYSALGQTDQAEQLAQQQLAANPNDSIAINNALIVLMQAKKYPEAIQLLEKLHASPGFTTEKQYVDLAKLYLISSQQSDDSKPYAIKATTVLDEGFGKGLLTSSYDNYKLLGAAQYNAEQLDKALETYRKAASLATNDGEAALHAGDILVSQSKYAQAKPYLQQAIDKGLPHKGRAYMLLGECERKLKNRAAAIAAVKHAAQDPETADKANAWLKQAGNH